MRPHDVACATLAVPGPDGCCRVQRRQNEETFGELFLRLLNAIEDRGGTVPEAVQGMASAWGTVWVPWCYPNS